MDDTTYSEDEIEQIRALAEDIFVHTYSGHSVYSPSDQAHIAIEEAQTFHDEFANWRNE